MGLAEYHKKRRFGRTPEPKGRLSHSRVKNLYVIQKHAAGRLHYDFRLELDGTLKSWAVPKGPSLDPAQKRLAVHVEDHPVEYGQFEGIIPKGEYGGGTVMLWDRGTWQAHGDAAQDYKEGRLKFRLEGERLQGSWMLVRMKGRRDESGDNWLLIKETDEHSTSSTEADPAVRFTTSVATGRAMEDIAAQRKKVWSSNRTRRQTDAPETRSAKPARAISSIKVSPGSLPNARKAQLPSSFKPQLATPVETAPQGDRWIHEIKFDGYRMLCFVEDGRVRLETRGGLDWTHKFPTLVTAVAALPVRNALLDGEVMVLRPDGRSDFQALQNLLQGEGTGRLLYHLFDVPYCQGYDLTNTPLLARKAFLSKLLEGVRDESFPLRYTEHIQGRGPDVFLNACRMSVEGIVSKEIDSRYVQKRSPHWVKTKCRKRQDFVIGGFTDPGGSRKAFGSLLLGYYDSDKQLRYAGRVGTGFTEASLQNLMQQLRVREVRSRPFASFPSGEPLRGIHWVRPELIAEVEFTGWTSDGILRHSVFQGLREDKKADEVIREEDVDLPAHSRRSRAVGKQKAPSKPRQSAIALSNPQKIMYPEEGITKQALAEYYQRVADWILPHIVKRPLAVVRCPEGHPKGCFYQKHVMEGMPEAIHGVRVKENDVMTNTLYIEDLEGLIGLVQLGVLEIHPWGTRIDHIDKPDRVVFDLDPAPDVKWLQVMEAARLMRDLLQHLGLQSFVKTTGGKGLHVVVPIEPSLLWEEVKAFSKAIAGGLAGHAPDRYIDVMTKSKRKGKIFVDYLRNGYGATSVAAYSTRARPGARVSTPIRWEELTAGFTPDVFTVASVPDRLRRLQKDPWAGFLDVRQSITSNMRRQVSRLIRE